MKNRIYRVVIALCLLNAGCFSTATTAGLYEAKKLIRSEFVITELRRPYKAILVAETSPGWFEEYAVPATAVVVEFKEAPPADYDPETHFTGFVLFDEDQPELTVGRTYRLVLNASVVEELILPRSRDQGVTRFISWQEARALELIVPVEGVRETPGG